MDREFKVGDMLVVHGQRDIDDEESVGCVIYTEIILSIDEEKDAVCYFFNTSKGEKFYDSCSLKAWNRWYNNNKDRVTVI